MRNNLFNLHAARSIAYFSDFYQTPPTAIDIRLSAKHRVGNITWLGEKGRMYKADPAYTSPREDNIFDPEKLAAVIAAVRDGRKIVTDAPLAHLMKIDRRLVDETQESFASGRLWEYGISRPFDKSDIGHYWVRIRDGNHRIFGAFMGGAKYAWVTVLG